MDGEDDPHRIPPFDEVEPAAVCGLFVPRSPGPSWRLHPQTHKLTQTFALLKEESQKAVGPVKQARPRTGQDSGQRNRMQAPPKTTLPATTSQSPERMPAVANSTAEIRKRIHPRR